MGWFDKPDKPAADGSQSKSEADKLVEALGAKLDERLKPFEEKITNLEGRWNRIEEEAVRASEPPPKDPATLTPEERNDNDKKALLALSVQANARITESECLASVAEKWPSVVPQLKEAFAKTSLDVKARSDYATICSNAVDTLVGRAARSSGLRYDERREGSKFFIEDSGGTGGGNDEVSVLSDPELTWVDSKGTRTETPRDTLRKLGFSKEEQKKFEENLKNGRLQ